MGKRNIPVKKGHQYPMQIIDTSHKGEGIGKYEGFTVFVPGGVPGDELVVEIISTKKSYARGLIRELKTPSVKRMDPSCSVYDDCGGCQVQHIGYEHQLQIKETTVRETLKRIGGLEDIVVKPIMGMKAPWHYRNKAQFPVGVEQGDIIAGCYRMRTHEIINVSTCAIQHQLINRALQVIKREANILGVAPYNEAQHKGVLRHIVVRVAPTTRQVMVVLVTRVEDFPQKEQFAACIANSMPEVVSIMQSINDRKTNVIMGKKTVCLHGQDHIIDRLLENAYKISARSFYQVNSRQTEVLYQQVLEYAQLTGSEIVVDAYCGIGTITLTLANKARQVYGVEVVKPAVRDAKNNATLNNISNAEFIVGKAEEIIPQMVQQGQKLDLVVVDPPRKGCDEALLAAIAESQVPKMIYVSCNPSTLARDLGYLTEHGYQVLEVQPVDMFPHTSHVETVCLLERR